MIMIMYESVMEYTIDDKRYTVKDDKCTVILFAHLISSPQSDSSYPYGYPRISKDPQGTTAELVVQPLSWRGTTIVQGGQRKAGHGPGVGRMIHSS